MKKMGKLLLLVCTLYPFCYLLYFITAIMNMMVTLDDPSNIGMVFPVLFVMHMIAMLSTIVLMVFYVVHAVRSQKLTQENRIIWIILIFLGNMISMPIYWYLYIWRTNDNHSQIESKS